MWDDFSERHEKEGAEVIRQFLAGRTKLIRWRKVSASRLKKIWNDYAKFGFVRDENGLNEIAESVLDGIARLEFSTEVMGHSQLEPREVIEGVGYDLSDEQIEKLGDFLTDKKGNYMLSDYGLDPLMKIYPQIMNASTPEKKLIAIDMALNVAHQRSDLAEFFVEGGSNTLSAVKNQRVEESEQPKPEEGLQMSTRDVKASSSGWILYLDDERTPKDGRPWIIARTAQQAKDLVLKNGMPDFISFDHDLGIEGSKEESGYDFAKWLTEMDMDGKIQIPDNFEWYVHSANPEGAKNIRGIMNSYMQHKKREGKVDEL